MSMEIERARLVEDILKRCKSFWDGYVFMYLRIQRCENVNVGVIHRKMCYTHNDKQHAYLCSMTMTHKSSKNWKSVFAARTGIVDEKFFVKI